MNTVTLDQYQIASGVYQAEQRKFESQRFGHSNARGLATDSGQGLAGSLGEVAAHVYFNLPFSYSINQWNEPDLITAKKYPVDVKTTSGDALFIAERHLHEEWIYLLVKQLTETTFEIIGWISGREVSERYTARDFNGRHSPAYRIPAEELHTRFH